MHRIRHALTCLIAPLLLGACAQTRYEVHVEPDGQRFERSLSAWKVAGDASDGPQRLTAHQLAPDEARRIAALYGRESFDPGETLSAHFGSAAPDDIGGAGRYLRLDTPFGALVHYSERVGGSDDLVARFDRVRSAARRLGTLTAAWFEHELGDLDGWPELEQFLQAQWSHDLANLGLTLQLEQGFGRPITAGARGPEAADAERIVVRLLMVLAERDYFELRDLPRLLRAAADGPGATDVVLLEPLRRLVSLHLGVEPSVPGALDFLSSVQAAEHSWERFRSTTAHDEVTASWPRANGAAPHVALLTDLVGLDPFFGGDHLALTLTSPVAPHWTNGRWTAANSRVRWELPIPAPHSVPALCYALWAEPDEAAQREQLGVVALREQALIEYVVWYAGLSAAEQSNWDAQLGSLDHGRALKPQIVDLYPPGLGAAPRDPRELILAGLDEAARRPAGE